jgi:hypothetical protein
MIMLLCTLHDVFGIPVRRTKPNYGFFVDIFSFKQIHIPIMMPQKCVSPLGLEA